MFLPPSYKKETRRRYPVVYALHGYSIGAEQWSKEIHVPQTLEGAFAQGAKELIVVLPDSKTLHNGSMYSSSVTTGDFENFIARDVVAYMDAHYRTIPERRSRGLVGHSMGGYGATRIGMKHSGCVRQSLHHESVLPRPRDRPDLQTRKPTSSSAEHQDDLRSATRLPFPSRAQLAVAAAWSPNVKNPPLYVDLPMKDGAVQADVLAKWAANAPLAFVDQYIPGLRSYHGISLDVGDQDGLKTDTGKAPRRSGCVRDRERLRDLPGHAHERGGRSLPESRRAVLQRQPLLYGGLQVGLACTSRRTSCSSSR